MSPDQIVKWANECNVPTDWRVKNLVAFASLVEAHVRADEREICAKQCENVQSAYLAQDMGSAALAAHTCAEVIRAVTRTVIKARKT